MNGDSSILIPLDNIFIDGNLSNAVSENKVETIIFKASHGADFNSIPVESSESLGYFETLMRLQLGLVGIDPCLYNTIV